MRLRIVATAVLAVALAPIASIAAQAVTTAAGSATATGATGVAYKYVLDYDVPESPAFAILGLSPSKVLRASAAKPVAAQLLNQVATGGKAEQGIALDFAPWLALGGGFQSVDTYRANPFVRWASRFMVSAATVQPDESSETLRYGAGLRLTLLDSRDPLANATLANTISGLLANCATAPTELGADDEAPTRRTCSTRAAYDSAEAHAEREGGHALSVGFGTSGRMLNGLADRDSLTTEVNRAWLSYRFAPKRMAQTDFLATTQWKDGPEVERELLVGVAARINTSVGSFAGEIAYGSESRTLHPGFNAEFRIVPRVSIIAALVSDSDDIATPVRRVRFRTNLRWNLSETGR